MKKIDRNLCLIVLLAIFPLLVFSKPIKPRIAIQKPETSTDIPKYLRNVINGSTFQNEIELAIQATNKFEVVTRQKAAIKAILDEQAFSDSNLSSGQAAETGRLSAANLLVQTSVQSFRFYRKSIPVPNIDNKYKQKDSGFLSVSIKILDSTSGAVKRSFILNDNFVAKQKIVNRKGGLPHRSKLERMYKNIAIKMSSELIDTVFPMLVIQVKGNSVFLNRGKDSGLKNGEKLIVYHTGEELIDPYTGESLGSTEEKLGFLTVVNIRPKFTIATPVDKSLLDRISANDIVRKP